MILDTTIVQLSLDGSIAQDRLWAARDRYNESETIAGASFNNCLVDVAVAAAAAGSDPVQNPRS